MNNSSPSNPLLSELKVGESATVLSFLEENPLSQRLQEMGITPGEKVEVVRYAPMGDPIEIKIRGYLLSLRKDEAELIEIALSEN